MKSIKTQIMKYNFILNILLFCTLASYATNNNTIKDSTDLKKEAKAFSLSIAKAYLAEDFKKAYSSINDSVLTMDGDDIILTIGKEDKLCSSVKSAISDKEKTFEDYIETYNIDILTPTEIEEKLKKTLPDYYKTTKSDFFFLGYKLKEDKTHEDDFIWDDMFLFMVRKEKKKWAIKGISG